MAGAFFDTPELALSPDEAKAMAEATANVAAHYNTLIDPKLMAWFSLFIVAGGVYGPRIMVIRARHKAEAAAKPSNVLDFNKRQPAPMATPAPAPAPRPTGPQTPADMFGLGNYSAVPVFAE
jgi:hypothetical protein